MPSGDFLQIGQKLFLSVFAVLAGELDQPRAGRVSAHDHRDDSDFAQHTAFLQIADSNGSSTGVIGALLIIERELLRAPESAPREQLRERLDEMNRQSTGCACRLRFAEQIYNLRGHIDFVRRLVGEGRTPPAAVVGPPGKMRYRNSACHVVNAGAERKEAQLRPPAAG